jgi:pyruvate-ferredoxin/flavodoxin oxidoreductase
VIGAYEFATAGRARQDGKTRRRRRQLHRARHRPSLCGVGDETPSLLPEGAVAVRFHSIGGWGAITTGKNLGAIIGDLNDLLLRARRPGRRPGQSQGSHPRQRQSKIRLGEEGRADQLLHGRGQGSHSRELRSAPRDVVLCCDPKAFTHTNPLDGMQEGGSLVWESDEEGEQAWERLPLWARKQIIDKNIRVFTLPGFAIAKKATDRGDLQLRMQGNAFLGAFFAVSAALLKEFGITQEQYREVVHKQYVKKFGKLGDAVVQSNMEVMMQGFDQVKEIKIGALAAADRSSLRGQALLPILELATAGGSCGTGCRSHRFPPARARAHPSARSPSSTRSSARPLAMTSRLRRSRHGRHRRGHRRHRLKVCRAPRDSALHSRELHAVHGVHLGVPGYGAAQHLAGSEHAAHDGGFVLRRRPGRPHQADARSAGRSKRPRAAHGGRDEDRHAAANHPARSHRLQLASTESDGFSQQSKQQFFDIIAKVPMAYQKVNAIFSSPERKSPGSGGIFSIFVSDLCKGCAACVTACGDHEALKMVQETEEVNAEHETGTAFLDLLPDTSQKYLGSVQRRQSGGLEDRDAAQHADGAHQLRRAGGRRRRLRGLRRKERAALHRRGNRGLHAPVYHAKSDRFVAKAGELEKTGVAKLAALKRAQPR